jgi:hypothetical protein
LKDILEPATIEPPDHADPGRYAELYDLQPQLFRWKATGQLDVGFIAQELQAALAPYPEFAGIVHPVSDDSRVYLSVDYSKMSVLSFILLKDVIAQLQLNAPAAGVPAAGADNLWGLLHSLYQHVRQLRMLMRAVVLPTQLPELPDWPAPPVDWVTPRPP